MLELHHRCFLLGWIANGHAADPWRGLLQHQAESGLKSLIGIEINDRGIEHVHLGSSAKMGDIQ